MDTGLQHHTLPSFTRSTTRRPRQAQEEQAPLPATAATDRLLSIKNFLSSHPAPAKSTMLSFLWGGGFDINKLRPHLKMAVQRIGIAVNKKTASIKYVRGVCF